jgi:ferredoxin
MRALRPGGLGQVDTSRGGSGVIEIHADLDKCEGYANCIVAAPDVYDIDDDGKVFLLRTSVQDSERARVSESVRSCPASALSLAEGRRGAGGSDTEQAGQA